MNLIILHDLNDNEVLVNMNNVNAALRKYPEEHDTIKHPFTKLYYVHREKGMEGVGFPDAVKESPQDIADLLKNA